MSNFKKVSFLIRWCYHFISLLFLSFGWDRIPNGFSISEGRVMLGSYTQYLLQETEPHRTTSQGRTAQWCDCKAFPCISGGAHMVLLILLFPRVMCSQILVGRAVGLSIYPYGRPTCVDNQLCHCM